MVMFKFECRLYMSDTWLLMRFLSLTLYVVTQIHIQVQYLRPVVLSLDVCGVSGA